jgi:Elongation factor P, C-terminal
MKRLRLKPVLPASKSSWTGVFSKTICCISSRRSASATARSLKEQLPQYVERAIASTEPGGSGDTAAGGATKVAQLETGLEVRIPLFMKERRDRPHQRSNWDRDTMVVETAGFNDKTALDAFGHPHSDALHVTERFHRRDFGHLDVEMTFDDSKTYTKPFTIKVAHYLLPDADIFEMFCNENEKDRIHLEGR